MNNGALQILVLAAIAVFLVFRLKGILGTRDGFEPDNSRKVSPESDNVVNINSASDADQDIHEHVDPNSDDAVALKKYKAQQPDFSVNSFLSGARQAYEMIIVAYEKGDRDTLKPLLSADVYDTFDDAISDREEKGLHVDFDFLGVREIKLTSATYDDATGEVDLRMKLVGEFSSVVKDASGKIVEGDSQKIIRQKDDWTFARIAGDVNPNWRLVATST